MRIVSLLLLTVAVGSIAISAYFFVNIPAIKDLYLARILHSIAMFIVIVFSFFAGFFWPKTSTRSYGNS